MTGLLGAFISLAGNLPYYSHEDIQRCIPLNTLVRTTWNKQVVEGIVLAHHNIDEHDSEDYDWPEDAQTANVMSVEMFHEIDTWWFDCEEAEYWIDNEWCKFAKVMLK